MNPLEVCTLKLAVVKQKHCVAGYIVIHVGVKSCLIDRFRRFCK